MHFLRLTDPSPAEGDRPRLASRTLQLLASRSGALVSWALGGLIVLGLTGCPTPPPTMRDAGTDAGPPVVPDARVTRPDGAVSCTEDSQCDDGVDCTVDECAPNGVCRQRVDIEVCDDGVFCNGIEQCHPRRGCQPGTRETCNDGEVCTVDRCDEASRSCVYEPRDLDLDGDPDFFCEGGGDCDDRDSTISSLVSEVCEDRLDNDCDGMVDESECGAPRYDVCSDPLDISRGGFFSVITEGAQRDYAFTCPDPPPTALPREIVTTFTLAEARSFTLTASGEFFPVTAALRQTCDSAETESACQVGFPAVIRRRRLEPGTYFVLVGSATSGEIELDVRFDEPLEPIPNDTCETPMDVSAGGRFEGNFIEAADDYSSECAPTATGDLVYSFTTTETQDVTIRAESPRGDRVSYSVRRSCGDDESEIRCGFGTPAEGRIHELPPGTYFLVVEASLEATLDVGFEPPTQAAAGDACSNPLPLVAGTQASGTFAGTQNDHPVSCGFRYRDVVYEFSLSLASDVEVTLNTGGVANVALRSTCDSNSDPEQLFCVRGNPAMQRARNLAAGTYYVVAESPNTGSYTLDLSVSTPPTVAVPVSGNDDCSSAYVIPPVGGLFVGTTDDAAVNGDYTASSCVSAAAAPDVAFQLTLATASRVRLSTEGSDFDTVLHVHQDACVSGGDVFCDDDSGPGSTSQIDRTFDAGTYFIVVDGFSVGDTGNYSLEVIVGS